MVALKVVKQLAKEFWGPLLIALGWAFLGGGAKALTVTDWITRFSTAFFFLSWLGGQLFRVSKQVRTETSLTGIRTRIEDVVTQLEASAKQVAGWASGGDSFVYLAPIMNEANTATELPMIALCCGDYPVYGVSARIADIDRPLTGSGLTIMDHIRSNQHIQIGELASGGVMMPGERFSLGPGVEGTTRRFNIFLGGRNGQWTQLVRFRHDGQRWWCAIQVFRGNTKEERVMLHEQIDERFPSPETLDWD